MKQIINQHFLVSQSTEKFIKYANALLRGDILYKTHDHRLLDFGAGTETKTGNKGVK